MSFLSSFKKLFGLGGEVRDKGLNSRNVIRDKDPNHVWEIVGELGDGAFGKVYKAHKKDSNELAALKQVEIKAEDDLEDFLVEIDILTKCKHKNVVGLHETYYYGGKLWMFIEFCGGGAVDSIMVDLEKSLKEDQIRYVCHEMCEGLAFIHSQHVIHRDLKAGNVLLTLEGDVRLADFGVSAFSEKTVQKRDSFIGTPYWMAPEVILCETMKDTPYNYKADIWSLGITLIEFAQIEPPNHEMHPMRVLIKIQKADPPTLDDKRKWSSQFHDFLRLCLTKDPEQRPNAVDLLKHPFISTPPDKKVILDLISESKAEVVEIVEDLNDEEDFKEIKRHLNNDSSSDLDKYSQASVDLDKREETPEKQQVKEKLVERKSANEVQPKTDKILVPPDQSKTPDTTVSKSDSTPPAIATCLDSDQTSVEILKQPQEAVIKPAELTLSPSPKNEENTPPTISTESAAMPESQAELSPVKEDVEEQKAIVLPPAELVEEYEDKSSDEGLGASADEKSATSSQDGSPSKVTEVQIDLTPLANEVQIDLTPLAGEVQIDLITLASEIVDEIIDDVLSSTFTDPSVPAVVLAAIEENIKVETERENDIPVNDTDELKPADIVNASDDDIEQVPKRQNSVSEIINNLEKIGQEKHKEPYEIHRLDKRNDSRYCPESESVSPQESHEVNEITKPNEVTSEESIVTVTPVVNKDKVNDDDLNKIEERENLEVERGNVNLINTVDDKIESSNIDDLITINGLPVPAAGTVLLNDSISKMKDSSQDKLELVKTQLPESPKRDELPKMPHTEYQTDLDTLETKITNTVEPLDISNPDDESSNDKSDAESITTVDSIDKDEVKESPRKKLRGHLKPKGDRENKSQYRTLTKTRTFVVNGEIVVSKVQRVVLAGEEHRSREDHMMRKQDLRELKLLQKNENKQYQDLIYKAQVAREAQERKFEMDMQGLVKNFDQEMDTLTKQQKQQVEKAEVTQALEQKASAKRIKTEQEKDFKTFKDKQKLDRKLMQQEFDMIAKTSKKDDVRNRKEQKEIEIQEEERTFSEKQTERMDKHMKQLTETHQQKIAMLESQYLQQKQQLLRTRESSIWDLEKQQLLEKHQLAKSQLKDLFFLKRHQMLTRHQKEIEQMKRSSQAKEEEIQHRHLLEKKRLPKILKQESKTRSLMFKESLRLSVMGNTEDERVKLKQFEENEKKRMKSEQARQESKHKKQWEELITRNESSLRELEQLQAEKRKMLTEHETQKIKELDEQYSNELREWKANLIPRKQKLEEEFLKQREEQEHFYGPVVVTSDNEFSRSAHASMRQKTDYASSRHSTII